ncbi:MAG: hypothetical protein HQ523_04325 [Lentisphaerae bacterium]|nr:hypothetical protein [Lentisphaerota bacterium]
MSCSTQREGYSRWSGARFAGRLALLVIGAILAVFLMEILLRLIVFDSGMGAARELRQFRTSEEFSSLFVIDPEFGFRPVLDNELYDRHGILRNHYKLEKRDGVTRLLFMGDSVTARGRLVDSLRKHYGESVYEYWNAGVESFNTVQELAYYQRYNSAIQPDHVILFFHLNDFESTPVAFRNATGKLVVFAPNFPVQEMNESLYRWSYIYRMGLGIAKRGNANIDRVTEETGDALRELKTLLTTDGVELTVVVLPFLRPLEQWSAGDRFSHDLIIRMLQEQDIRHFDLLAPCRQAIRDGIDIQETAGDDWHPSQAAANRFADDLSRRGLLTKAAKGL